MGVTYLDIPLGCPLSLTVATVNSVQTLKGKTGIASANPEECCQQCQGDSACMAYVFEQKSQPPLLLDHTHAGLK
jgi:hypothetical protein